MKIGIDIDGVLTDEHTYVLDNGTKYFSENNISYIVNRNVYDSEEIFGVSEDEYNNFWKEYIFEYSKNIPIRCHASDIIKKLKEKGNEIFIITSRSFTTYENENKDKMQYLVKEWLNKNSVLYDEIIFTREKADICKQNNIDLMIEDKPENIEDISKEIPVIVYDCPYNEKIYNNNVIRCYSWYDIYEKIEKLEK